MEDKVHFDTIVIGSDPGEEGTSIKLAKASQVVAIVDQHALVDGDCTLDGNPQQSFNSSGSTIAQRA